MSLNEKNNILMRTDGRKIKPLSIGKTDNESLKRNNDTLPENDESQGFKTHIHCRWCNRTISDVYIPKLKEGRNGKPYDIVFNYEPCSECRSTWGKMVIFIEVSEKEPYRDCLPIDTDLRQINGYIDPIKNPAEYNKRVAKEEIIRDENSEHKVQYERIRFYPTGRYTGVTLDATKRYFIGDTNSIHNGSVIYLEQDVFERAFSDYFEKA